ncbi:hypothetical protein TUMSATVNIG1_42550 [Vibrio nigripulchritudo]|uniref:DUF695 domain-containing protein n=1 Tax=Vibrio nigripulchritudo TaxID=28173 RepID=UPI00190B1456|nr:DUF695 domain-containing protein [Vibrio nigripulchritudo]BCL72287.1 hypothetical protein VNTUMSATTG_42240 [Vibrio nigripulchritudo]BDU33646.1 hypothetical protein TUMSATVNIG1_42550 [Vibrio nigripulchritudo]
MLDIWHIFPAAMGENQAWISYNHGYSEIAEEDPRNNVVRVELQFKDPTDYGMPTNEEYLQLSKIDEKLEKKFAELGGVYVGRVTVDGHRFFYFYLNTDEKKAAKIISDVSAEFSYRLQHVYERDIEKSYYWEQLYPTVDDWQVIQDLKVLNSLSEHGDIKDKKREVMHWAYFPIDTECEKFSEWAKSESYVVHSACENVEKSEFRTKYSHVGTMNLGDITSHTIRSNRKARELGGRYDGWETSVERE